MFLQFIGKLGLGVLWLSATSLTMLGETLAQNAGVYTYDELGRVVRVDYNNGLSVEYDYDDVGNRNSVDIVAPTYSVSNASANEGGNIAFTITRSSNTHIAGSVDYATSNGTASTSDYTATSGTASFGAGETSKIINVPTTQDSAFETNETLTFTLSNAADSGVISVSNATGTIVNDDGVPSFSVNDVSVSEGGNLVFTVSKTGASSITHNVNYATANGTATAGSDYTAKSGALSFTTSQSSKTVTIVSTEDTTYEANETLYLNLSSPTSGALISDSQGVGTINNDDPNELAVSITGGGPVNLRTIANANGYTTSIPTVRFTLTGTVTGAGGSSSGGNGGNAIDTGTWPGAISLILVNNGVIRGGGGGGGEGGLGDGDNGGKGGNGGHAIYLRAPLTITNNGTISGGGGGGGGGDTIDGDDAEGGGGGGGFPNGDGGNGTNFGDDGSAIGGGDGGNGEAYNGADGGNAAQNGQSNSRTGSGGAAGYAVKKNGNSATVIGGTVQGTVG